MASADVVALSASAPALGVLSTIAAGICLLLILYRVFLDGKRRSLPPGPWLHFPVIGDGIHLSTGNPLLFFFNHFKRYGPVYRTQLLGARIWVVNDMAALQRPLRDDGGRMEIPFRGFKMLMGESFLNQPGVHGPWRKVLSAAMGPPALAALVPRALGVMRPHVEGWEAAGRVPIFRAARLMGVDLGVDVIMQVQLPPHVDRVWVKQQVEVFLDGLYALPLALPGSPLARALAARYRLVEAFMPGVAERHAQFMEQWAAEGEDIQAFADAAFAQHHRKRERKASSGETPVAPDACSDNGSAPGNNTADGAVASAASSGPRPSIMTAQLMGRAAVGRCELRDAALSICHMLVAAADTTRFALFNTWALLAMSPRVQDKLFAEQQQVIAQFGPELSYAATCSMPYMDATLKECMRLLPASSGGMRRLTADLRVGQYVIPKGEIVWYHAGLLHCTDPALWDGSTDCELPPHMDWRNNFEDAFRPERWLGGEEAGRPRSYYTFGTGIHLCVGMNLVYLELKLLLSLVLRKYRLRLECADMLRRCTRLFPFLVPEEGTDGVRLEPREAPAAAA